MSSVQPTEVIVSARNLSFEYLQKKPILKDVNFTIRSKRKITIMGQNGSGKTTLLKLLAGQLKPDSGDINIKSGLAVGTAKQTMGKEFLDMTVWDFFKHHAYGNTSALDGQIASALNVVKLDASHDRLIKSFSGGQQARLLLASGLVLNPDLLLLDEPTNNLDIKGVQSLTEFIRDIDRTVVVRKGFYEHNEYII
jgi:ATP-binding cassette subfamily F protein uup